MAIPSGLRPWQKGQSGNPAGRPRVGESVAEYVRKLGGKDGRTYVDILDGIAKDDKRDGPTRIKACMALLERGYGSVKHQIEHTGLDDGPMQINVVPTSQLSDAELDVLENILTRTSTSKDANILPGKDTVQ